MQSFRRIKVDVNDTLYSKIIRFGKERCPRCKNIRDLQCAHIIGRTAKSVRWQLWPKANAIPLCSTCHDWFDSHKISACIFDERKRVFNEKEEGFTFLVKCCGYSWNDLAKLYAKSQSRMNPSYDFQKKEITRNLREVLSKMEISQ